MVECVILSWGSKGGRNFKTLLPLEKAGLFRLTAQGGLRTLSVNSRDTTTSCGIDPSQKEYYRIPNNQNNEGNLQPQVDLVQTVKFVDDDNVEHRALQNVVPMKMDYLRSGLNDREHGLKDFLSRPILCGSFTWTTSSVAGALLPGGSIQLPDACRSSLSFKEKLRGFMGFRAKMICRVQINAQRFQQGRLILTYIPQTSSMPAERIACATSSLVGITQLPHVELDVAADTEVLLEIPYVSTSLFMSLQDGSFNFGTFYPFVYSALSVGSGSSSCTGSVWCHFEDIELMYPAAQGLYTQSGIKVKRARGGASVGKIDSSDAELQSMGLGPISSFASRVSSAATILSEIPLISAFTAPTAWASGILSRAASAMGYSKPVIASAAAKSSLTAFAYMNNVNAVDNSSKMSMTTDNHLENLPGFAGTDVDEMAFSSFLQVSTFFIAHTWTPATTPGSLYSSYDIRPEYFFSTVAASDGTVSRILYYHTPMGYLSNIFQYWRGSIKFTFKVVKTEYHSGRLMAAFFPGTANNESLAAADYCYREIFDLRDASEFTITVPYTATTPYLRYDQRCGRLNLFVLNSLTSPSTVSSNVQILVEVSAGPDMEFAFPVPARKLPIIYSQSGLTLKSKLWAQGLGDQVQEPSDARIHNITDPIGGQSSETLDPARYCIGERILSVRQMIKRAGLVFQNNALTFTSSMIDIYPYANYVPSLKLGNPISKSANYGIDLVAYFAPLYRYYRGGMRYKLIDNAAPGQILTATLRADNYGVRLPVTGSGYAVNAACANQVVTTTQMQGGIELEVPYYGYSHSRTVWTSASLPSPGPDLGEAVLQVSQSAAYSANMKVFRFAADDFSYGFFIGCPPLTADVQAP